MLGSFGCPIPSAFAPSPQSLLLEVGLRETSQPAKSPSDATITRSLASKTRDSIATGGGDGNYVTCEELGKPGAREALRRKPPPRVSVGKSKVAHIRQKPHRDDSV